MRPQIKGQLFAHVMNPCFSLYPFNQGAQTELAGLQVCEPGPTPGGMDVVMKANTLKTRGPARDSCIVWVPGSKGLQDDLEVHSPVIIV